MCTCKCGNLTHTLSTWKIRGKFELVGAIKKKTFSGPVWVYFKSVSHSIKKRLWFYYETVLPDKLMDLISKNLNSSGKNVDQNLDKQHSRRHS